MDYILHSNIYIIIMSRFSRFTVESSVFLHGLCFYNHSYILGVGPMMKDDKTETWRRKHLAGIAQLGGHGWIPKGNGNCMM